MPEGTNGELTQTGQLLLANQEHLNDQQHEFSDKQNELGRYLKIILWVATVLFLVAVISLFRSFQFSDSVESLQTQTDDLKTQTNEAREASVQARDSLEQAIEDINASREANAVPSEAIVEALQAVARIEEFLCDGPCDQVEQP